MGKRKITERGRSIRCSTKREVIIPWHLPSLATCTIWRQRAERISPNRLSFHAPFPDCVAVKEKNNMKSKSIFETCAWFTETSIRLTSLQGRHLVLKRSYIDFFRDRSVQAMQHCKKLKIEKLLSLTLSSSSLVSSSRRLISCIVIPCHRSSQQNTCLNNFW